MSQGLIAERLTGGDHGGLSGLADDDHTQYLLAAGTRALTADWDAGGFELRGRTLQSDVPIGTAPLVVASTTLVVNLNADLLDGESASAFADASHVHAGADITTGTVADARLSSNVPLLNAAQSFSAIQTWAAGFFFEATENNTNGAVNLNTVSFDGNTFAMRFTGTASGANVGGFDDTDGGKGRILLILNVEASNALLLNNEDGGRPAADRIITGTGADLSLSAVYGYALMWYDETSDRWRVISTNGT